MTYRHAPRPDLIAPELKVTRYDRVSAALVAIVCGLLLACLCLGTIWLMARPPQINNLVAVELLEWPGGVEDGAIDETLLVQSPEDPVPDAAPEERDEAVEIDQVFESITEMADVAAEQLLQQFETDAQASGQPGSREGTGRRALGANGGEGGLPPEQRWFIQFNNQRDLDEYARQLDFFGIELGTILPDGRLLYLSQLSQPQPARRETSSGRSESRLYMSWQGGALKAADQQLFRKAGIETAAARILHFYPPTLEAQLLTLEQQYANRKISDIRRTYFQVLTEGNGYRFQVTRQSLFR